MAVLTREITVDNFMEVANLPEFADRLVELVDGEISTMALPNAEHGEIIMELGRQVGNHVKPRRLGRVTGADAAFLVERDNYGDTIRGLDVAFISARKAVGISFREVIEVAPDLAIEVMSPSNTVPDIRRKIAQLINAGCPHVWIVHPDMREVDIHTEDGMKTFRVGDTLSAPDILPGLEIAVSDIFPD